MLEAAAVQTDRPQRPVPRYFAYHDTTDVGGGPAGGAVAPGSRLQLAGGTLSVHDDAGRPIDPVATACAFVALMTAFPAVVSKDFASTTAPNVAASQLGQVATAVATAEVRVRMASLFGVPFENGGARLTNVTAVNAAAGVYRLDNPAQPILVVVPPPTPNDRLVVGPATFGVLDTTFTGAPLAPGVPLAQLRRDFLSLFVDDLNLHLRGREKLDAPSTGRTTRSPPTTTRTSACWSTGTKCWQRPGWRCRGLPGCRWSWRR